MSQVMKALKQSEKAYQAQQMPPMGVAKPRQPRLTVSKWLLFLCAFIPLLLVILLFLFQSPQKVLDSKSDMQANKALIAQASSTQKSNTSSISSKIENKKDLAVSNASNRSEKPALTVQYLKYPNFEHLESLPQPVKPVRKKQEISQSVQTTKSTSIQSSQKRVDDVDLSSISPELADKFRAALKATSSTKAQARNSNAISLDSQQSRFKGRLPAMNFQAHVYVSDTTKRWVKVNGKEVHIGGWLVQNQVKFESMTPRDLTVSFQGQYIQIPALYEWKG